MTSSLVGSEMCIRDRNDAIEGFNVGHNTVSCTTPAEDDVVNAPILNWNCLLYTSDAADDM
eukprot:2763643-Prorocentrum_lima.AAC.1